MEKRSDSNEQLVRSTSNQSKLSRASIASRLTAKSGLSNPDDILKRLISCNTSVKIAKKVSFGGVINLS
jgi:hypothetical protein